MARMAVRMLTIVSLTIAVVLPLGGCSEPDSSGSGDVASADAVGDAPLDDLSTSVDTNQPMDTVESPCEGLSAGSSCDHDEDPCTLEVCDEQGQCVTTGEFEDCAEANEQNPCWAYVCNGKAGCVATNFIEGLSCDDNVACTQNDTCTVNEFGQESCLGTPIVVDDDNPCTDDACSDGTVTHEPIPGAPCPLVGRCEGEGVCDDQGQCIAAQSCPCETDQDCDDGDPCNGIETCAPSLGCMSGESILDDDGIACTDAVCDSETGLVTHVPLDALCDDSKACNGVEICDLELGCVSGEASDLDDGITCTLDDCDDVTGEVTHTPWSDLCDPGGVCQYGVCDALLGCVLETTLSCCGNEIIETGEACDDGNDVDGDGCSALCEDEEFVNALGPNIQITANLAHTTMARFDDRHTATVYAASQDPLVAPDYYRIVIHKRVGKELTWKGDWYFDTPVPAPGANGTGSAFALFAAIGPHHLIAVRALTDGGRVLDVYAWDGDEELALVSSTPVDDGKGFFWGHPVDDNRFIWRYRYDNSGEPVTYQVITRDGDTLSFGPEMIRPGPEIFPGLSDNISQAEPILMRMGPTTFREIRPGYVWEPGYLASYTLQVNGTGLSWSDPVVHDSSGFKTMEPLVAANGEGGGAVIFPNYEAQSYQWGVFETGSTNLQVQGPLFNGVNFYGQGAFESTDGYVGGSYFLRLRDGQLYRLYSSQGMWQVDPLEGDLATHACSHAPHITRVGPLGLFLRCTGTNETAYLRVIDLYPSCGDGALDAGEACDDEGNENGDGCSSVCTNE